MTSSTRSGEKVRENRLRRMATRQGLILVKSRRRDFRALDYGQYWLAVEDTNVLVTPERGVTLDGIENYLNGDREGSRC
jgi:Ni/Co efflux regulator RcnB